MSVIHLSLLLLAGVLLGCSRRAEIIEETQPVVTQEPETTAASPAINAMVNPSPSLAPSMTFGANEAVRSATATPAPTLSPTPAFPIYQGERLPPGEVGVQIHLHREDQAAIFNHLVALGVGWVKAQVSWKVYEPQPGDYDRERLRELDQLVARAETNDIRVLLSVAKAPEWSRSTTEFDGPPSDPAYFEQFMTFLASRYRGRVAAYELWNEPNLQREWNGVPLDAEAAVSLMRAGANGVRRADPDALLVSGAPATTGINDGVTAMDDRVYLQAMLAHGAGDVVDAVGVHPYGWANPPEATAAMPDPVAPTHNDHPSFFFVDTLNDYRALLNAAGHPNLFLWVTEFGWSSAENMGAAPPEGAEFMTYVDEWQQAVYTLRALEMAHERTDIGPLFLWNLNFAPTFGPAFSESFYSLLRPDGTERPVYRSVQTLTGTSAIRE